MKKAYSLLEVVVVMAVSLIILTAVVGLGNICSNNINTIKINGVVHEVSNLISFSKFYCRANSISGVIQANRSTGQIDFIDTTETHETIKSVYLPDNFSVKYNSTLQVNNLGHVQSDTIRIKDSKGNTSKITISTGVDTVNVYIGEE